MNAEETFSGRVRNFVIPVDVVPEWSA